MSNYNPILGAGQKPALLICDLQRAYTEGVFDQDFQQNKEIETTIDLIHFASTKKIPIIYTAIAYDDYEILHPNMWLQKIPVLKQLKVGNPITKLDPRLPFQKQRDWLLIKKYASAFFGTPLAAQLTCQKIDTLFIMGCTTSGCVRATVVDGIQHGFRMMVVKDAVADRWPEAHEQALFEINAKYGDVIDSTSAMTLLSSMLTNR